MTELENYYNQIYILFGEVITAIMIIPIMIAVLRWQKLNKPLRTFFTYVLIVLLLNIFEQSIIYYTTKYYNRIFKPYLDYWDIGDTSFFQIFYYLNSLFFLTFFFSQLLPKKYSRWITNISFVLILAVIINYLFIEGYKVFGTFNPIVAVAWGFILPAFYLWYLFKNELHFPLNKNPYFWFSFGLVFVNLIGLFLYLIGGFMHGSDFIMFTKISITKIIFNIISYALFALGFWFAPYACFIPLPSQKHNERSV